MSNSEIHPSPIRPVKRRAAESLRGARVLLAGLGNIGSFLLVQVAPLLSYVRVVDRDVVEQHNTSNQFYDHADLGRDKVDVMAERVARLAPGLEVERRATDLEDLPWGDLADVDLVLGGLDSLRARQILAEKLYPLGIPYIDGAVGEPLLTRVQVLLPGQACLECSWGPGHYRQLTSEFPCQPNAAAAGPRTSVPSCAGAATAAIMVAQCLRIHSDDPPRESYEIQGDLLAGRCLKSRRRRNPRCHFTHETKPQTIRFAQSFDTTTVGDLIAVVEQEIPGRSVQLEFRRGILDKDLFGASRYAMPSQLLRMSDRRLAELGLTARDRVVVRARSSERTVHLCFDSTRKRI